MTTIEDTKQPDRNGLLVNIFSMVGPHLGQRIRSDGSSSLVVMSVDCQPQQPEWQPSRNIFETFPLPIRVLINGVSLGFAYYHDDVNLRFLVVLDGECNPQWFPDASVEEV